MLKTYQFKTHCKGDSHSCKTANIILPGLVIKQRWTPLRLQAKWCSNSTALCWMKHELEYFISLFGCIWISLLPCWFILILCLFLNCASSLDRLHHWTCPGTWAVVTMSMVEGSCREHLPPWLSSEILPVRSSSNAIRVVDICWKPAVLEVVSGLHLEPCP